MSGAEAATDWATIAAVASAVVAFVSALVSVFFAQMSRSAQSGALELEIRNSIRATKTRVADLFLAHQETLHKGPGDLLYAAIKGTIAQAIEENVNAYDEACAKYLDNKVDKVRFKKSYQTEIRQLVENPEHKDFFGRQTQHHALVTVYEEWEQKPKNN